MARRKKKAYNKLDHDREYSFNCTFCGKETDTYKVIYPIPNGKILNEQGLACPDCYPEQRQLQIELGILIAS